jgi:hypothetical protein
VDPRELTRSYKFGASSVTVGRICQMESLGYFAEDLARESGEEIVSEPNADKVVVFKEFFVAGLRMLPHRTFIEILLKFRVQLHQLTPNAIAQMSKYFCAVLSCGGEPISLRRSLSMDSTNINDLVLSIFMGKGAAMRGLFWLRRTSG